jgi:hypothetical protein
MQHKERVCHACRSPLNGYPFSRLSGRTVLLYCTAQCCVRYERERRHQAYTASVSPAALSSGASHERQTEEKATQRARATFTFAVAFASGIVLAIGAIS